MATRRRVFVVFFSEKEEEEPVVMAVAGSLKKAKALSVEAYNELNDAYPMQTQAPTVWQDDDDTSISGPWFIERFWLDEIVKGESQ